MLGPRRRRKVTYNEARLARAQDGGGLTPVKEGADEDFQPAATAMANSSDSDTHGCEQAEGADGAVSKRGRPVCALSCDLHHGFTPGLDVFL